MEAILVSRYEGLYERLRPLIIWLGLTELGWIIYWLVAAPGVSRAYVAGVVLWVAAMLAWLVFVIVSGMRGFFLEHTRWLSNLVGSVLVVAFGIGWFSLSPFARDGILAAASAATDLQLVAIHILRLLSVGAFIKYLHGELPRHFVLAGAVPDFAFAVSAVVMAVVLSSGVIAPAVLVMWHLAGFSVFLGAGVSMFFSVPSPFRIFESEPDTSIVFRFPMVLAPNFTVPLFMLAHAFALVGLFANV
ncbi:MAG: hypothetical protein BMS9Abin37_3084 [Acidobacteriota bacterium]|nr:MAG: hypothetical protein BMS9Abin37_3084 [Acidobacteriota bacterium]